MSRHEPVLDQIDAFFATLYAGQTGILELRTFGPEGDDCRRKVAGRLRDFVPFVHGSFDMHRIAAFLQGCYDAQLGAFFGVALRTTEAATDRKGDAAHCQTLTALFVDADFKYSDEATTRKRLADFPIPPSILVKSGGGLHPYWLLDQPIDLRSSYDDAHTLLQQTASLVADNVDASVSEPARVLRIPLSWNFKYDPPRQVELEIRTDATINADELSIIRMVTPTGTSILSSGNALGKPSGKALQVPESVIRGERHAMLRDLMRSIQARGVPLPGALAACHIENRAKCDPPIPPAELDSYLRRVATLPDRPGFTRTALTGWELAGSLIETGVSVDATLVAVRSVTPDFDPEKA